jgi:sugar phosphate isomerase/epimerase
MEINMEFGVQIFGCLSECKQNPDKFFKRMAQAGYTQIEPCILFDDPAAMLENAKKEDNTFLEQLAVTIWKPEEVPEYVNLMGQYGLQLSSAHVFAADFMKSADKMIETAKKNGITAYVVNCNQQTIGREYEHFAKECIEFSHALRDNGIELWIHNNGAEIKALVDYNGKKVPALSAVLDLCKEAEVGAQIDVGWVLYGGIDPVKYLKDVKAYVRSIHFKDLKKDYASRKDGDIFACLGDGALKVADILNSIPLGPQITVLVDQDASDGDIMSDQEKSWQVLNKHNILKGEVE